MTRWGWWPVSGLRATLGCCAVLLTSGLRSPPAAAARAGSARARSSQAAPVHRAPSSKKWDTGVSFIRIQKTGSSTFGDKVMPAFCRPDEPCLGGTHRDWNEATLGGKFKGSVVTLLRDPVERAFSEFFWLRDEGQWCATQPAWDFHNDTWLKKVADTNLSRALDAYIFGYPKNPSRNRQAMYILGFRDKDAKVPVVPGKVYDWDKDEPKLVRRAVAKLENLTAFGITDCWVPSMRAFAHALGWNAQAVEQFAGQLHERYWRKAMVVVGKRRSEAVRGVSDWKKLVAAHC